MDVNVIQRLSEQCQSLKSFHEACNCDGGTLIVKNVVHPHTNTELDYHASKTIIIEVRHILLERIREVEKEIKKEATGL